MNWDYEEVKIYLSDVRRCQHCSRVIKQALLRDGRRVWLDAGGAPELCPPGVNNDHGHAPFDIVPVADPTALAAWLDS